MNYGNRSHVLHSMGRAEDALLDAETAIKCCPEWAKGHYRKAKALISLGRQEEAITSMLVCSVLEETSAVKNIMDDLFKVSFIFSQNEISYIVVILLSFK